MEVLKTPFPMGAVQCFRILTLHIRPGKQRWDPALSFFICRLGIIVATSQDCPKNRGDEAWALFRRVPGIGSVLNSAHSIITNFTRATASARLCSCSLLNWSSWRQGPFHPGLPDVIRAFGCTYSALHITGFCIYSHGFNQPLMENTWQKILHCCWCILCS